MVTFKLNLKVPQPLSSLIFSLYITFSDLGLKDDLVLKVYLELEDKNHPYRWADVS